MRKSSIILFWFFLLVFYSTDSSANRLLSAINSTPEKSAMQNDEQSKEEIEIECEARKVIGELSAKAPEGTTLFYYKVRNGVQALAFVQQSLLKHTDNFILIDKKTSTYLYDSSLLKVEYTENKKKVRGVAEAILYFKRCKVQYTIIFTR